MKITQRGKYAERDTDQEGKVEKKKMLVAKNRVELQTQWAVMVRTAASSRLRSSGAATPSPVNLKGTTVSSREKDDHPVIDHLSANPNRNTDRYMLGASEWFHTPT